MVNTWLSNVNEVVMKNIPTNTMATKTYLYKRNQSRQNKIQDI